MLTLQRQLLLQNEALVAANFATHLPKYATPSEEHFFVKVGSKRAKSVQDESEVNEQVIDPTQTKRFKNPEEVKVAQVVHDLPSKSIEVKKMDTQRSMVIVGMAKDVEGAVPQPERQQEKELS